MNCLEYACDMGVSSGLLTDSHDDGASPRNVVAIVLQAGGTVDRLMCGAIGGSKCHPIGWSAHDEVPVFVPEFSRFCVLALHGIGVDRPVIVARMIGEESRPRFGLALILLGGKS